jgi:hypothetical protein
MTGSLDDIRRTLAAGFEAVLLLRRCRTDCCWSRIAIARPEALRMALAAGAGVPCRSAPTPNSNTQPLPLAVMW